MQDMNRRTRQVANLIREELVDITRREIHDPRVTNVGMITFSSVDLSPDRRNATVYVSFMGQEADSETVKGALAALRSASGFYHRLLVKRLKMRNIPQLIFRYDQGFDRAAVIQSALKEAEDIEKETKKVRDREEE